MSRRYEGVFIKSKKAGYGFMAITYCLLLSITSANSVVVPIIFMMRGGPGVLLVISVVSFVCLIFSHFEFYYGQRKRNKNNYLQWIIVGLSAVLIVTFIATSPQIVRNDFF